MPLHIWVLLISIFLQPAQSAVIHPPVSIVVDSQGRVFYSDLANVWMITPDGSKHIAVQNVHTHKLWLDSDDILYGEDVANTGDTYRHRVWKRVPGGGIKHAIDWRAGHPTDHNDYGFEFDKNGAMYVLLHRERRIDVYSQPFTEKQTLTRSISLRNIAGYIHWHTVKTDGTVYAIVGDNLVKIPAASETVEIVAQDLIERTPAFSFLHNRHTFMGLWVDDAGNVYVSVFAGQQVKQIDTSGNVKVYFRQTGNWSIAGGTIDKHGNTWLLEFSDQNEARVRKISAEEETVF